MAYPILAPNSTWYKSSQKRSTITQINIVDSYTPTGSENETWNADTGNTGSIKCYRTGTVVTIAGNGSGKIAANADSSYVFSNSASDKFSKVEKIDGVAFLDTSGATTIERMFQECSTLKSLDLNVWNVGSVVSMKAAFSKCISLETLDVSEWNTESVKDMTAMFQICKSITSLDLSKWNVGSVENMMNMFYSNSSNGDMALTTIGAVENWDTKNVTNMSYMFQKCSSLGILNASNWDTSKVTTMSGMFQYCNALNTIDVSNWNTQNVTNMGSMFRECTSLQALDVSKWDVSNVTSMAVMFEKCYSLTTLNVSRWDVSKVTNMNAMFQMGNLGTTYAPISELDVSNWDTSSCTDMSFMFYGFKGADTIDVSNWNVSKVTNFDHMFAHSYQTVDVSKWDTSSATNFYGIFHGVQNTVIDVSSFNTSKVTSFGQMFENNGKLTAIIGLENFDTSAGVGFDEMFKDCVQLKELNLSSFDTTKAKDGVTVSSNGGKSMTMYNIFYNTPRLEKITLGANFSFNGDGTTTNATNVATLPTPNATYIEGADGNWYTFILDSYAPANIPNKTAGTYYGSVSLVRDADVLLKNGTVIDIAAQIKEKTGATSIKPIDMPNAIANISGESVYAEVVDNILYIRKGV